MVSKTKVLWFVNQLSDDTCASMVISNVLLSAGEGRRWRGAEKFEERGSMDVMSGMMYMRLFISRLSKPYSSR